jgi:hypothetical protein
MTVASGFVGRIDGDTLFDSVIETDMSSFLLLGGSLLEEVTCRGRRV